MAARGTKGAAKAPATKAEQAATAAAPAAAEQLATQPAATTGQPVSEATGLEAGKNGQDAQPNTDQAAADAAAATSSPASAAPEASVGDAAAAGSTSIEQTGLEAPATTPAGSPATDAVDDLVQYLGGPPPGHVRALFIQAVPEQGFRRIGRRFTREGTGIALDELTDSEVMALAREPNLTVREYWFDEKDAR